MTKCQLCQKLKDKLEDDVFTEHQFKLDDGRMVWVGMYFRPGGAHLYVCKDCLKRVVIFGG